MAKTFSEKTEDTDLPDMAGAYQSFQYTAHLLSKKSEYQKIDVYETKSFGRILALDDVVQLTEKDAFMYHEMLVHVPMMAHYGTPKDVLIIGGGDGFAVREVVKHDCVEDVTMIEIDMEVCDAARKFFGMTPWLNHDKLETIDEDAAQTLRKGLARKFDVAIIDATDAESVGGKAIYNRHFMASLVKHMNPGGVISVMQGVPMVQGVEHVRDMDKMMEFMGYSSLNYAVTVPTYYGGVSLMSLYCNGSCRPVADVELPEALYDCRQYNTATHEAAFILPTWLLVALHG